MPAVPGPEPELRRQLVAAARRMNTCGVNQGTSGNLSVRIPGGMLITPSSLPYEQMEPADLVALDLAGAPRDAGARDSGLAMVAFSAARFWAYLATVC